ncbi:MAG: hypothetical protein GY765_24870, partial [bacterium]|nr:hypothetical protein [bacterium]
MAEIDPDINDEVFMAVPCSLTLDPRGNLYVYDRKLRQIFKFDKDQKFLKVFGKKGNGPGELGYSMNPLPMRVCHDGFLYVGRDDVARIMKFDCNENYIGDIRLPYYHFTGLIVPAIATGGTCYILTRKSNGLEARDKDMKLLYTRFSLEDYKKILIWDLPKFDADYWEIPSCENTQYDLLPDNRLVVYMGNSSTVYIFDGAKLVRQFNIRPKYALEYYKYAVEKRLNNRREKEIVVPYLHYNFFLDKDNWKYFYLSGSMKAPKKHLLYKFDLEGKLIAVLYTDKYMEFSEKKNNQFYG